MKTETKPVHGGLVITVDGEANPQNFSVLKDYQNAVGGYIEIVGGATGVTALANEDGRALNLPFNQAASVLLGTYLVGNVVLIGDADEDGNWTSIPFDTIDRIVQFVEIELGGK